MSRKRTKKRAPHAPYQQKRNIFPSDSLEKTIPDGTSELTGEDLDEWMVTTQARKSRVPSEDSPLQELTKLIKEYSPWIVVLTGLVGVLGFAYWLWDIADDVEDVQKDVSKLTVITKTNSHSIVEIEKQNIKISTDISHINKDITSIGEDARRIQENLKSVELEFAKQPTDNSDSK